MDVVVGRRAATLFADALVYVLVRVCVSQSVCVCVSEGAERREGFVTGYLKGKKKSVCACGPVCVCVRLYAALTGSESRAGKVLRRVIMRNLRRVHTGALWVFLFVLAISFFLSFFFFFYTVAHMNEISNVPQWLVLGLKEHSSAY